MSYTDEFLQAVQRGLERRGGQSGTSASTGSGQMTSGNDFVQAVQLGLERRNTHGVTPSFRLPDSQEMQWRRIVASKPSDWLKTSDIGLAAYERDREQARTFSTSAEGRRQSWIEQQAMAPLLEANPLYFGMVRDYAADTSYKELNDGWSEEQRRDFGYYYAQDKKKAEEFAIKVNDLMKSQAKEAQRQSVGEKATDNILSGAWETAKAIGASTLGIGEFLQDSAELAGRGKITEKSGSLSPMEYYEAVTGSIGERLNEYGTISEDVPIFGGRGLGDVYGLGTSIAQSMASAHLLGGTGTLVSYFGSAAASAVDDARRRGATDYQALLMGALSGAAEAAAEKIGVDNLFKLGASNTLKGFLSNILKQSASEGLEEGITSIITEVSDRAVMGDLSTFNVLVQDYMERGWSEEEAKRQAWQDRFEDIAFDAIGGFASGGVSGGLETGLQNLVTNHDYRRVYLDSSGALIQQGLEAPKGSLSNTLAQKYQSDVAVGKKLSGADLHRLVRAHEEQAMAADLDHIRQDAADMLTQLGEPENITGISDVIAKVSTRQKVTKAEQAMLSKSIFGQWLLDELNPDSAAAQYARQTGTDQDRWSGVQGAKITQAAADYTERRDSLHQDSLNRGNGWRMIHSDVLKQPEAQQETVQRKEVKSQETEKKSTLEQEVDDIRVSDDGKTRLSRTGEEVTIQKIETAKDGVLTFRLEDGRTVKANELEHGSESDAILYDAVASLETDGEIANLLVDAWKENPGSVSAESYALGMTEAFRYGTYNLPRPELEKSLFAAKLTTAQQNNAYILGQRYGGKVTASRHASAKRARMAKRFRTAELNERKRQGKVVFDRRGRIFSDVQEASLQFMELLSTVLDIEFHVFESYVQKDGKRVYKDSYGAVKAAPNGWYEPESGRIYVDLNAGKDGSGTMMFTIAHELTHFIRQWSPSKFKILANCLMEHYAEQNISVAERIDAQILKAKGNGRSIDFDTAYEELVADSMEAILVDGNVVQMMSDLKQQDTDLWTKIRDWFQNLVQKIKNALKAYEGKTPDSIEGRFAIQMQSVLLKLEKLYANALMEASENYQATQDEKTNVLDDGTRYSVRSFSEQVDDVLEGKHDRTNAVYVGKTPDILQRVGLDGSLPMLTTAKHIRKAVMPKVSGKHQHGLTIEQIKHLPQAIADPVMLLDSRSDSQSIVVVTDMVDPDNSPVIAVIRMDGSGTYNRVEINANFITSFYGRDRFAGFLDRIIANDGLLYVNKEKATTLEAQSSTQWLEKLEGYDSKTIIRKHSASVKEKFSIRYSERDPVQLRAVQTLERENARLREDVGQLKSLLKLQRKVTGGRIMNPNSVQAAASALKRENKAGGDTRELSGLLNELYSHIASYEEVTWDSIKDAAKPAVDWLMEHRRPDQEKDVFAVEVLREIRGSRICLDETQKKEAARQYGSYNDYRKMLMGTVVLTDKHAVSLDSAWQSFADMYPSIFNPQTNSADMPAAFADAVRRLRDIVTIPADYGYSDDLLRQDLLRQVYDSYWDVSTYHTAADVKQRQIDTLKEQQRNRLEEQKDKHARTQEAIMRKHREVIAQLKTEHTQVLKEMERQWNEEIKALRKSMKYDAEQKQAEIAERYRSTRKKTVQERKKTVLRHTIRKRAQELEMLLKGSKEKHVKEGMRDLAASAIASAEVLFSDDYSDESLILNGIGTEMNSAENKLITETQELLQQRKDTANRNLFFESGAVIYGDTTGYDARMKAIKRLDRKISKNIQALDSVLSRERKRLNKATVSSVLDDLAREYKRLENAENSYILGVVDADVYTHLMQLREELGGTVIRDMTVEQLKSVSDAYTMVLTAIKNANKLFRMEKSQTVAQTSELVMEEVKAIGGIRRLDRPTVRAIRKFGWNNLKPVYVFETIGSGTFSKLFANVRDGEDAWFRDVTEAKEFYQRMVEKYHFKNWEDKQFSFTSSSGLRFTLNLQQVMSLYAYSKREQALGHLKKGGIVIDETSVVTVETKLGAKIKLNPTEATAYNLSEKTLSEITDKLTKEQRAFVDEMQDYLSNSMSEKGNAVSMEMYGIRLFQEKNYFPLRTAKQYLAKAREQDNGEAKIKNKGFTKGTVPKADNPVVLSDFVNLWAEHVDEMSMYHAFALPLEDFYRVYNYHTRADDVAQITSVNSTIQNAYGRAATEYIDRLLRDLNGGVRNDPTAGVINKAIGIYKKGAVLANLSVTIQQSSAIAKAAVMLDVKHFTGRRMDAKRHKQTWAEVKRYAPVAGIKEMGYFDTNMGMSTRDYILQQEYNGISEKAGALITDAGYRDELFSRAPALADELTWCCIWEAVKREGASRYPKMDQKSEAFLQKCGERFTEVIVKTQVYDSVLSRSANMRSKDTGMKMATAFMAEPTTAINIVLDGLIKAKRGGKEEKRYCRRAIGAVVAAQILNAILVSFPYAARDDDEEKTIAEKYVSSFLSSLINGLNPMSYLPFIKDVLSTVQGYEVERSDMAVINDLWNAWEQLGNENISPWKKVEGFAGGICLLFGVPLKNIMRDVRSLYQAFDTIVYGEEGTQTGMLYAIENAFTGKTRSNARQLYIARLTGDTEHEERVRARYDDEDSADAAVRAAIKDRYLGDEIDVATALKHMVLYSGMDGQEAHWLMDAWKYRKENGTDDGYAKYGRFYEAVRTNTNLEATVQEYLDNGVEAKTLLSQITTELKPEYLKQSDSQRENMRVRLIRAMVLCGREREDAEKLIEEWDFEAAYGFSWDDRKQVYLDGDISRQELIRIIRDEEGKTEDEASLQVEVYDWHGEGYDYATVSNVRRYNEHCRELDIDRGDYLQIMKFSNNTENDVDENGESIRYSAARKVAALIEQLYPGNGNIAEKTAIYKAIGWSDKTLNKVKTW